ncbi:MAG: hypothetical protein ACRD0U_20310, partial [Acidimicrobiales bacterium]
MTVLDTRLAPAVDVRAPAPRDVWWQLLRADPHALPSQSPDWIDCLCEVGGYEDASRLYTSADGHQVVLPLVRRSYTPVGPSVLESMPAGWGFGGLVAPGGVTPAAVATVFDDLLKQPALRVHIRPNPLHAAAWQTAACPGRRRAVTTVPCCAHVLDLAGGFEHIWRHRFRSTVRNQVRRAERMGVVVETDSSGRLVPVFHALLVQSFDRWARLQHEPPWLGRYRGHRRDPLGKFQVMAARLGEALRVSVAWHDGRPVAA